MNRIADTFARLRAEQRTGLVAFLTVGHPSVEDTLRLVPALIEGGADIIELAIPFSDPLAEGPSVQRSSKFSEGLSGGSSILLEATMAAKFPC